jgi:uncharacterized caspase-like protein
MANNWAIVIGINDYQHHPERRLKYAVNDAQRMGNFLTLQAGFDTEKVILCLGDQIYRDSATYPTCDNLLRLLKRDLNPNRLDKISRLWFYFSGHGVSHNGRDYLITSNCLEDEIERFALPIDEVIAALQSHKEADIVLILDACRQLVGRKNFENAIGKQTIASAKERGITTIFSCDYGQYSYELDALQQGVFTHALVEGLAQHTLPHQLETYLRQRVPDLHWQHRQDRVNQTPRIRIEPTSKTFHPLLPDATPSDIAVLVDLAKRSELEEDFVTAKQIWWQVIRVARSDDQIQEAENAIRRVDQKTGDRSAARSVVNHPLTRQQFIKWAIPAGIGAVGVIIINQFLGNQSQQPSAIDYSKLESFLKARRWKEADQETINLMLRITNQKEENWVDNESVQNFIKTFPCDAFHQIDRLWVNSSGGKFGFSVQKRIYIENCGGKLDGQYDGNARLCLADAVGWRMNNKWINYSKVSFNTEAKEGHLPVLWTQVAGSVSVWLWGNPSLFLCRNL